MPKRSSFVLKGINLIGHDCGMSDKNVAYLFDEFRTDERYSLWSYFPLINNITALFSGTEPHEYAKEKP